MYDHYNKGFLAARNWHYVYTNVLHKLYRINATAAQTKWISSEKVETEVMSLNHMKIEANVASDGSKEEQRRYKRIIRCITMARK